MRQVQSRPSNQFPPLLRSLFPGRLEEFDRLSRQIDQRAEHGEHDKVKTLEARCRHLIDAMYRAATSRQADSFEELSAKLGFAEWLIRDGLDEELYRLIPAIAADLRRLARVPAPGQRS